MGFGGNEDEAFKKSTGIPLTIDQRLLLDGPLSNRIVKVKVGCRIMTET